jgi:ATP-dependent DNA ligase
MTRRQHLFEIKRDGIRWLVFVEDGCVRSQSRQFTDISSRFPELCGFGAVALRHGLRFG